VPFMVWSPRRTRAGVAAIAISSALLVAACGSSGSTGASSSSAATQIVIGAALPLTGSAASYGAIMKDGMQLAVNEINASGGIHGAKLKVDYVDSQGNPGLSVGLTRQLLASNVVAITTCFPAVALAQEPLTAKAKTALLGPCLNENAQLNLPGFYNLTPTTDQERSAMLQYMYAKNGIRNVAILSETATSPASNQLMINEWKSLTGTAPALQTIATGSTDATPQLTKLLQGKPDAIYVLVNGTLGDTVAKNLAALNVKLPIYGNIAASGYLPAIEATKLMWTWTNGVSAYTPQFLAAYGKAYPGSPPALWDGSFYSAVYIIKQGLEYAASKGYSMDAAGLYQALLQKKAYTGCCGALDFTAANGVTGQFQVLRSTGGGAPTVIATVPAPTP
jgi:ABC-type branched-subunit amino acid transport system substrate-binding protein